MSKPTEPIKIPTLAVPAVATHSLSSSFDAGINASSAWTVHLETPSDGGLIHDTDIKQQKQLDIDEDGPKEDEDEAPQPRAARALFDFEGKPEFRELVIKAGDTLQIHKEDLAEGWSLAQHGDIMGLIPRKYYTFTADFLPSPSLLPSAAPESEPPMNFLQPQATGPYLASLRQSLLGGKSFNRFSNFVTSGAEDYVLNGLGSEDEGINDGGNDKPNGAHSRDASEEEGNVHKPAGSTNGTPPEASGSQSRSANEASRHFVEAPPAWKSKTPPFRVLVHSPSKQTSSLTGSYTVYAVTSLFTSDSSHSRFTSSSSSVSASTEPSNRSLTPTPRFRPSDLQTGEPLQTHVTVYRRFSHFVFLHTALSRQLPGIALPPLPEKQYAGRFSDDFVEARRGDLERWISRVVRHPVARYSEVLVFFLSCDNETEWRRTLPGYLVPKPAPGPSFYGHVYHPEFNLDAEDASDAVDRFQRHLRAVGKGVQGLRNVFGKVREVGLEASAAHRALSYSILSLITSTPIDGASAAAIPSLAYHHHATDTPWEEDEEADIGEGLEEDSDPRRGLMNDEGAWCWRDGCEECLHLTKALQKMAETLQTVADIHDDHARRTQLATHDALKDVAHPSAVYSPVIDTHRATLSRYTEAASHPSPSPVDHEKAARCETVLNTTMAEFDTYHVQKVEDFRRVATEHLDGEIAFCEQILTRLKTSRAAFDAPAENGPNFQVASPMSPSSHFTNTGTVGTSSSLLLPPGPRQPSIYERDLTAHHTRIIPPLPQPAPHVYDSSTTTSAMRPVSVAVREGVGILLGGVGLRAAGSAGTSGSGFRGSVFDFARFWS